MLSSGKSPNRQLICLAPTITYHTYLRLHLEKDGRLKIIITLMTMNDPLTVSHGVCTDGATFAPDRPPKLTAVDSGRIRRFSLSVNCNGTVRGQSSVEGFIVAGF